jgi:Icc-related predicted phosphoesterase
MAAFTIYFATDIHGSERCFRKFLNAGRAYGADAVILGGDVTGKALVPVVEQAGGGWTAHVGGKDQTASDEAELEEIERRIRDLGFYAYRTSPDEHAQMAADEAYRDLVFDRVMRASVERWVDMADTRLRDAGLPCLVMPGNDDIPAVKGLLSQASWLIQGEDHVVEFGPYQVLSLGYSTVTPWHSPREISDDELGRRLGLLTEQIQQGKPVVMNVHNPPADSGTDLAFKLTDDMRIATSGGEPVRTPVGSRAVRDAIEQVQPVLSLHGHIHESRAMSSIGRTKVCNPGSLYPDGILQGVLITLDPDHDKVKRFKFVAG